MADKKRGSGPQQTAKQDAVPAKPLKQLGAGDPVTNQLVPVTQTSTQLVPLGAEPEKAPIVASPDPENKKAIRIENEKLVKQRFMHAIKTKDSKVAEMLIGQLNAVLTKYAGSTMVEALSLGVSMIEDLAPQNTMQSMLAVQLVATHFAGVSNLSLAGGERLAPESVAALTTQATRLMRLNMQQMEFLARLKGQGGQQRVVVEHVTVVHGGHAIVGHVTPGVNGLEIKSLEEPHERPE